MENLVAWLALALGVLSAIGSLLAFIRSLQQDYDTKVDFDYYDARHEGLRRDVEDSFKYVRADFERQLYRLSERVRYLEIRAAQRDGRPIGEHFNPDMPK